MRALALIAWPYHAGLSDVGMGLGASRLIADERLHSLLRPRSAGVTVQTVPPVDPGLPEVARIFELDRRLAGHVRRARARGAFPLVFATSASVSRTRASPSSSARSTSRGSGPSSMTSPGASAACISTSTSTSSIARSAGRMRLPPPGAPTSRPCSPWSRRHSPASPSRPPP